MNKAQSNLWFLLAVVFAICLTVFALSYIVTEPWHIIPNIGGDGAKNMFTYLYHSIYGKGYWFEGMNYPYGEHIVYTDGQPLLSVLFASMGNISVSAAFTICWALLGIGYVLAIIYVYKTLIYFGLKPLPAILYSGLIGIMTPQMVCLNGHYALGYPCIIPMVFYWTIRYHDRPKISYCIRLFILGIITSFLHMYYAAMLLVWMASYTVGYFIFNKNVWPQKIRHVVPLLVSAACVTAIVGITLKLSDPVKDRPVTPLSLPESYAHIKQITSSTFSPLWRWTDHLSETWQASKGGEGFCYPGAIILAAIILFAIYSLFKRRSKSEQSVHAISTGFPPVFLFMALGILAFSMGIPFIWHMHWLMNYFSFFKQFRALGRFAWIFYYIICIYGTVVIYTLYSHLINTGKRIRGYALLAISMIIWSTEASGYIKWTRNTAKQAVYNYDLIFATHEQSWTSFLNEHHLTKDDFQAILTLKFFHIGSEKLWVGDGAWTITLSARAALQLHLPIVDVMMSRTSWEETREQVRIAAGPYSDKPLLRDAKSTKPFLMLRFEEDSLDADQKYLLSTADYIGHYLQCDVYALHPDKLAAFDKKYHDEVAALLPGINTGDTCVRGAGSWYVQHYDGEKTEVHLFGAGSVKAIKNNDSAITVIPIKIAGDSELYEMSTWFLLGNENHRSPSMELEMLDSSGNKVGKVDMNTKWSVDNYKEWYRANVYFYIKSNCKAIRYMLYNTPNPSYLYMDEMMLRPADALIISKTPDGSVMVNNHLFNGEKKR